MPTSFVLISDQREARWFRAGAPSCMANLSVPFKQASHCLLVRRERSETHEGGTGRQGGKATPTPYGERCSLESCRSAFKYLSGFFTKVWVQSPPAFLSLESLTPNPDLRLSLLLGSSDSCVGITSRCAALSQCNATLSWKTLSQ